MTTTTQRSRWDHLQYFSLLWGLGTLWHLLAVPYASDNRLSLILAIVAILVVVRSRSLPLLLALSSLQLVEYWSFMPHNTNHWTMAAFINSALLISAIIVFRRTGHLGREQLYNTFLPVGRVLVLLLYFFATFHKINADFFDPATSCAVQRYVSDFADPYRLPVLDLFHPLLIWGTLLIEGGIPLLLLFRRTRLIGISLGLLFHGILALGLTIPFFNFSGILFACFWLFAPRDFPEQLHARHARRWRQITRSRLAYILFMIALMLAFLDWLTPLTVGSYLLFVPFWAVYMLAVFYFFFNTALWVYKPFARLDALATLRPPTIAHSILIAVFVLNGLSPYLGFKTEYSFNMHSNLRVDDSSTNHLVIPDGLFMLPSADDFVEIVASDEGLLNLFATNSRPYLLHRFELERIVARNQAFTATIVYRGERLTLSPELGYAPFDTPHPINMHFRRFRPMQASAGQFCLI